MIRSTLLTFVKSLSSRLLVKGQARAPSNIVKPEPQSGVKFGVSYSVYDGEELLEQSLRQIRASVDYINAVYSTRSFYGDASNPNLLAVLEDLRARGLLDEIILFENEPVDANLPRDERGARRLRVEIAKRNTGLDAARRAGCTWFMSMDTDEFYEPAAFAKAVERISASEWSHTFVHILNYGKDPTRRYDRRKWEYYVPFFARVTESNQLGTNDQVPCLVDPSRCLEHQGSARYRVLEDIFMHHFTRVRRNLNAKYSTRRVTDAVDADWINNDSGFIDVPDYFGLESLLGVRREHLSTLLATVSSKIRRRVKIR